MTDQDPRHQDWKVNDWYVNTPVGRRDIMMSAEKAHRQTGKTQVVHLHPKRVNEVAIIGLYSEVCGLSGCFTVPEEKTDEE